MTETAGHEPVRIIDLGAGPDDIRRFRFTAWPEGAIGELLADLTSAGVEFEFDETRTFVLAVRSGADADDAAAREVIDQALRLTWDWLYEHGQVPDERAPEPVRE